MQDQARRITYGAMMIALFALLLAFTMYVPLLGALTLLFIPLPITLYRLRYDRLSTLLVAACTWLITLLIGGLLSIPSAIVLSAVGFVIGDTVRTGKSKLYVFMATGLTLLVSLSLLYLGSVWFFKMNPIEQLLQQFQSIQEEALVMLTGMGNSTRDIEKMVAEAFTYYQTIVPSLFILSVFIAAYLFVMPILAVAARLRFEVPKFASFLTMRLPFATVVVYMVLLLISILSQTEQGTTLYLMEANAILIFRFLFFIQGLALIYFALHTMKLPGIVNLPATLLAMFLSPFTVMLGVIDIAINVRAWIGKDKRG
ncbi:YybS family protein [Sporosarcina sp. FSL W7-1283]|uniref:YybS family protein n=1 Tax=Sporosarcina sp. FSL W7-1283 TaxID=2921560 RepID=UPI0030F9965F